MQHPCQFCYHMGMSTEDLQQLSNPVPTESASLAGMSPLPSSHVTPTFPSSNMLPVLYDDRAVAGLLEMLLKRAGLTPQEAAKQLGVQTSTVRAYLNSRVARPSVQWFVRFVTLCGGSVRVEFPPSK